MIEKMHFFRPGKPSLLTYTKSGAYRFNMIGSRQMKNVRLIKLGCDKEGNLYLMVADIADNYTYKLSKSGGYLLFRSNILKTIGKKFEVIKQEEGLFKLIKE